MLWDESGILMLIFRTSLKNQSWYRLNHPNWRRSVTCQNRQLPFLVWHMLWDESGILNVDIQNLLEKPDLVQVEPFQSEEVCDLPK
jgi:hypothetical protein